MSRLFIIRGLSGCGKSTLAKLICDGRGKWLHTETDMYHVIPATGEYRYDYAKSHVAHKWCQDRAAIALETGVDVVVSNTACTKMQVMVYLRIGKKHNAEVSVIDLTQSWGDVHNVPEETLQKQKREFIPFDKSWLEEVQDVG